MRSGRQPSTGKFLIHLPRNHLLIWHRYIGALSNSGRRSANYVGFYKGIQSAGGAVMWALDSVPISFMSEYASNFALLGGSLLVAAPIIFLRIKDTVSVESDLEGTDETLADVLPPSQLKGEHIGA